MELRSVAALIEASRKMPIWEAILCSDLEEDTPVSYTHLRAHET